MNGPSSRSKTEKKRQKTDRSSRRVDQTGVRLPASSLVKVLNSIKSELAPSISCCIILVGRARDAIVCVERMELVQQREALTKRASPRFGLSVFDFALILSCCRYHLSQGARFGIYS